MGTINLYTCSPGARTPPDTCTIIQHNGTGNGTATCTETSVGPTQTCSITQDSSSGSNTANVTQVLAQLGLDSGTQNATQNALVVQTSGSGSNTASVTQGVAQALGRGSSSTDQDGNDTDDVTPAVSTAIVQHQDAHQNVFVSQTATGTGANASSINQGQLQVERADHAPSITQTQNTALVDGSAQCPVFNPATDDPNSNQCNAVQQSSAGGTNNSKVQQSYNQFQAASNCCVAAAGTQIQGVAAQGGLDHRFSQTSTGVSTQSSNQVERLTQRRTLIGAAGLAHEQHGPIRKGGGVQLGNAGNSATQTQTSTLVSTPDVSPSDTSVVTDLCVSAGECTGTQTVTFKGQTTTQTQSGPTIALATSCTTSCTQQPPIVFDGSPGTAAPPATLGPYSMTAFGPDPQPVGATVTGVTDPAGTIGFAPPLTHSTVGNGWATWSNGYTGDVYSVGSGGPITITLPAGTRAFYLYAEPNQFDVFTVQATAQDGTTSGPVQVQGNSGAQYFGFYATGSANLATITVTTADPTGLAVGEFGIAPAAAPAPIG